jgi:hypothetical protein
MIKRFEKGKYYKYLGKERMLGWNSGGHMDFVLDNKPHLCVLTSENARFDAGFKEDKSSYIWTWECGSELWVECDDKGVINWKNNLTED